MKILLDLGHTLERGDGWAVAHQNLDVSIKVEGDAPLPADARLLWNDTEIARSAVLLRSYRQQVSVPRFEPLSYEAKLLDAGEEVSQKLLVIPPLRRGTVIGLWAIAIALGAMVAWLWTLPPAGDLLGLLGKMGALATAAVTTAGVIFRSHFLRPHNFMFPLLFIGLAVLALLITRLGGLRWVENASGESLTLAGDGRQLRLESGSSSVLLGPLMGGGSQNLFNLPKARYCDGERSPPAGADYDCPTSARPPSGIASSVLERVVLSCKQHHPAFLAPDSRIRVDHPGGSGCTDRAGHLVRFEGEHLSALYAALGLKVDAKATLSAWSTIAADTPQRALAEQFLRVRFDWGELPATAVITGRSEIRELRVQGGATGPFLAPARRNDLGVSVVIASAQSGPPDAKVDPGDVIGDLWCATTPDAGPASDLPDLTVQVARGTGSQLQQFTLMHAGYAGAEWRVRDPRGSSWFAWCQARGSAPSPSAEVRLSEAFYPHPNWSLEIPPVSDVSLFYGPRHVGTFTVAEQAQQEGCPDKGRRRLRPLEVQGTLEQGLETVTMSATTPGSTQARPMGEWKVDRPQATDRWIWLVECEKYRTDGTALGATARLLSRRRLTGQTEASSRALKLTEPQGRACYIDKEKASLGLNAPQIRPRRGHCERPNESWLADYGEGWRARGCNLDKLQWCER